MATVDKVLVVGGGVGGMSAAIQLKKLGLDVELIDIDPNWRVYGAGITITGPTLRAFKAVGILEEVGQHGAFWAGAYVRDGQGGLIEELTFEPLEAGVPATGGIMRPALHKILSTHTRAVGVTVRLGLTVEDLRQDADGVAVRFSDGSAGRYDLVVGADGIFSKMRERVFSDAPRPKFTGQTIWRIVAERPPGFDRTHFYFGPKGKLGFNPVSATHMYMFLLEHRPDNPWIDVKDQPQKLYESLQGWGGIVPGIREQVLAGPVRESINYRPLEAVLQPAPWYRGRVLLIGDAAHATTPHMASGAGMAVEDGVVLALELQRGGTLAEVLARFQERRFPRCKLVVENSLRLGEIEMAHGDMEEHTRTFRATMGALRQPL
ncbi:MAG: FAD-dependent oxidoreductase [Steroidobacteraceae bacterium]